MLFPCARMRNRKHWLHSECNPMCMIGSKEVRVMIGIQGRDQTLGSKLFGSKSEIHGGNPGCRQWRQLFCFFFWFVLVFSQLQC